MKLKLLLVPALALTLAACGGGMATMVKVDPLEIKKEDQVLEKGLYVVNVVTKDQCVGAIHSLTYEFKIGENEAILAHRLIKASEGAGTCGQVIVGMSKGVIPAIGTIIAADIKADAIEDAAAARAAAATAAASIDAEARKYAVDNAKTPVYYEDNRTSVVTEVDFETGVYDYETTINDPTYCESCASPGYIDF